MKIRILTAKQEKVSATQAAVGVEPKITINTAMLNFSPGELKAFWVDPDGKIIHFIVSSLTYDCYYEASIETKFQSVIDTNSAMWSKENGLNQV